MDFVNGKDYPIDEMENKKMFETTNQLWNVWNGCGMSMILQQWYANQPKVAWSKKTP